MIRTNARRFEAIGTFVLVELLVVGLQASTAVSTLAQTSGTWTTTGSLNVHRVGHTATLLHNGEVLVAGGEDTGGNILANAELYNPATAKWTVTGGMTTPRVSHTATLLTNGEVLVAGGIVGFQCSIAAGCMPIYTATAELYNPAAGKWTTTSGMTTPRSDQGATMLQDGQVLVAGGIQNFPGQTTNSPYWLASAELYDPSKGTWSATGNMNKPHAVVATLLQNGQVLIAEDQIAGELYHPSTGEWTLTAHMYRI